jgi:hypothetical protein
MTKTWPPCARARPQRPLASRAMHRKLAGRRYRLRLLRRPRRRSSRPGSAPFNPAWPLAPATRPRRPAWPAHARQTALRKSHMPATRRLPQRHMRANLVRRGQAGRRHKRIVQRIDHQRRHADAVQVGLGRRARPVVVGVAKAVQRRGEDVVELVEVARAHQPVAVEQAGVLLQLLQRLGHHGAQEHAGVDQPVEALADRRPPAARSIGEQTDATASTTGGPRRPSRRPSASGRCRPVTRRPPAQGPMRCARRCSTQPISSKSPEW